jgi:hypothetical protein
MILSPIERKVASVILADVTAVRIMMAIVALLLCVGFVTAHTQGGAYDTMIRFASQEAWAAVFGFYGVAKLLIAFHLHKGVPKPILFLFILFGLSLWLFTFFSFTGNQVRPFGAADLTVLAMCIGEVWVGAHTLADAE